MTALKYNIPGYRKTKFTQRGWTVETNEWLQPVCYKDVFTQLHPVANGTLKTISPVFMAKMNGCTVLSVAKLVNTYWNTAFDSAVQWIVQELQKQA